MPTQCQTSGLHCRVSFLGRLEMIPKDVSASLHEDNAAALVHYHCPPCNGLLTGLHSTSSGHPQHSKQNFKAGCWTQPDPCCCSQGRQEVKTREKSESHSLPSHWCQQQFICELQGAQNCICIFQDFCKQGSQVHSRGKLNCTSFQKKPQKYPIALREMILNTCALIFQFLFYSFFVADALCSLPDNSCCQRGRLGCLSCVHYEIIQVGALSSALKIL